MEDPTNNSAKHCRWCGKGIQKVAKICNNCGRDQTWFLGNLQRIGPIGLVLGFALVMLAISSQEIEISARADARQLASELKQLIADADERKSDIENLNDQSSQSKEQLRELEDRLGTFNKDMDSALREASQFTTNLEARFSRLQQTSQKTADVLYANEMHADIADLLSAGKALVHCDIDLFNAQPTEPRSVRCLREILDLRRRFASASVYADTYHEKMTREAWEKDVSSTLCYRFDTLATGYFSVSINDYVDNETWRNWTGYADDIITRTKSYIEDNSEVLAQCNKLDYSDLLEPRNRFLANISEYVELDGARSMEILVPDAGINIIFDDETHEVYEWRLGEEPRIRIIKHDRN